LSAARASTCSGTVSATAGFGASSITVLDEAQRRLDLAVGHFEYQLVVDLQQHELVTLRLVRGTSAVPSA